MARLYLIVGFIQEGGTTKNYLHRWVQETGPCRAVVAALRPRRDAGTPFVGEIVRAINGKTATPVLVGMKDGRITARRAE